MLPNETNERKRVADSLKDQLAYAHKTLCDYVAVIDDPVELKAEYPGPVIEAAVGLHVRIARKYRQIILLAEAGQADGAEVICRSLFEALLALAFICRENVELRHFSGNASVNLHGRELTQLFRALLFYAHEVRQSEIRCQKMMTFPETEVYAKRQLENMKPELDAILAAIGPEWSRALSANTCAGISISDFAFSLGREIFLWYRTIYAHHSSHVHVGDYRRFLDRDAESRRPVVSWHDSNEDIAKVLLYSTAAVGVATTEFAALLDPANQRYIDARLFQDTYEELKQVFLSCYRDESGLEPR